MPQGPCGGGEGPRHGRPVQARVEAVRTDLCPRASGAGDNGNWVYPRESGTEGRRPAPRPVEACVRLLTGKVINLCHFRNELSGTAVPVELGLRCGVGRLPCCVGWILGLGAFWGKRGAWPHGVGAGRQ